MQNLIKILSQRVTEAMEKVSRQNNPAAIVTAATDARFGDYQSNGVMALAKRLKTNPRQLAEKVVAELRINDICQKPEIAGPGFINLRLKPEFLSERLREINAEGARLGIEKTEKKETVVVDFSGPNIAKQMHVGHLRSTIIGDCICRMLEFAGHNVIRQNHIGDWGTQFGMLIAYLKLTRPDAVKDPSKAEIRNLEQFYKNAKQRFDKDQEFAELSRIEVKKLHNQNAETIKSWQHIVDESRKHYLPIYERLGVDLTANDECGESFYKDKLAGVVDELKQLGLAVESDGAVCVFPDKEKFRNKDDTPLPFIIQKSDGAFLYATTDLAAVRYRIKELNADRIVYVTDARQKLHFEMLFAAAKKAGWAGDNIKLEHVTFGSVLGEDGKPFKTRSGENVKLSDLLDEALERARAVVEEKNPELESAEKEKIANTVGIGAVKYADYSNNRTSDYVFSFERMLAMEGNTAPYMQYAYARIKSIEKKAAQKGIDLKAERGSAKLNLSEPEELVLAKHLLRYSEAVETACNDFKCNIITGYLYELAQKFSGFYSECPVIASDNDKRPGRLLLCELTARTIRHGLVSLLGIDVVEQM